MCFKRIRLILVLFFLSFLFFFLRHPLSQEKVEKGHLSIYFMGKKVGYEVYTWRTDDKGYSLEASGEIKEPIRIETTKLIIRLDKSFIPTEFYFKGLLSGVNREITSTIQDGYVESNIQVSTQKRKTSAKIRRDAFLLPSAIYSPYLLIVKKFRCTLQEVIEHSCYIIPELELPFTLEPKENDPCSIILKMGGIEIELGTDDEGKLNSIIIPSQQLEIINSY